MAEKSIEELINEATATVPSYINDNGSFAASKRRDNNYDNMLEILTGQKQFEFNVIDDPGRMKSVITYVKQLAADKKAFENEQKQLKTEYDELLKKVRKTAAEYDRQEALVSELRSYQLKKTLIRFSKGLIALEPIVDKLLDPDQMTNELTDAEEKKYQQMSQDLEDALFQEAYGRYHFAYDRGEGTGSRQAPTVENIIPIKFLADNGKTYYGLVRPPTGIITWEGKEARNAWINDKQIVAAIDTFINKHTKQTARNSSIKYTNDAALKIRVDPQTYKVYDAEPLNKVLLNLKEGDKKKITYNDSTATMEKIFDWMYQQTEVVPYSVWDSGSIDDPVYNDSDPDGTPFHSGKIEVKGNSGIKGAYLDDQRRPWNFQKVINSIDFWKFIRTII
jgi:hypothetical protein